MATTQMPIYSQQQWSAPRRAPVAARKPSGIEALAMSVGASRPAQFTATGCIGSKKPGEKGMEPQNAPPPQNIYAGYGAGAQWTGTQWALPHHGYGVMPAVGGDQLQVVLTEIKSEMEATNARVKTYFGPEDSLFKQWSDYFSSYQMFVARNFFDTPLREADALQRAYKYRDGLNDWNYIINVRMSQSPNVHEGKLGESFPILPAIGILALVGLGAAFLGAR